MLIWLIYVFIAISMFNHEFYKSFIFSMMAISYIIGYSIGKIKRNKKIKKIKKIKYKKIKEI